MAKRLLVIEDTKAIAAVIQKMGSSLGYEVTVAYSFGEVKKLLGQDQNFHVATVDYSLPDAPNGEVIPYVLEHGIATIVMTGRMDDGTRKKILNLPVVDYITKENAQAYHYLLRILHGQLSNSKIGVLVVDDSLTARNHVSQLLKRRNFNVMSVSDGEKALKVLKQFSHIKIVVTDQEMPGMDGIALVQKIRKLYDKNELIIIGISGANRSFQSARFIKNGADDFLRKPFCPEEFYCRIMHNIEKLEYLKKIESAAQTDYVTALYNRHYFLEQATKTHQNIDQSKQSHMLVILQVDGLKEINDQQGLEMGDQVLITLAKLLTEQFKDQLIARIGGSVFGLLLSGNSVPAIEKELELLREKVTKHVVNFKQQQASFTVSLGGVILDRKHSIPALLKQSEQALYQAKDSGSNNMIIDGFIALD